MRILYTPEGGSKREWEFDFLNPEWDISFGTEKATDWPWSVFTDKLGDGSSIALQALIYVLRKRTEPRLILSSVTPSWSEVEVFMDEDADAETDDAEPEGDPDPEA